MSPTELNRQVAETLGEDLEVIQRFGFSLVEPEFVGHEYDLRDPFVIDWDATDDDERVTSFYDIAV